MLIILAYICWNSIENIYVILSWRINPGKESNLNHFNKQSNATPADHIQYHNFLQCYYENINKPRNEKHLIYHDIY